MGAGGATDGVGRSTPRLIADTFGLYRRYPWLFLALAAAVILPEELIVLVVTGSAGGADADELTANVVFLVDLLLVLPLVSALHVHGVEDVRRGEEPRLGSIARRGLAVLPVVCAATIMSSLGTFGGALLFLLPGVYLWVRWLVVAQVAAIEHEGWTTALRRSWALSEGAWLHTFVFGISIVVLGAAPAGLFYLTVGDESSSVAAFVTGTALSIVCVSFTALATALLYYDLRARREALAAESEAPEESAAAPTPHSVDPRVYSDEDRPSGWYVDPRSPGHMRYWEAGEQPRWHDRKTRTPRKLRREWGEAERTGRES